MNTHRCVSSGCAGAQWGPTSWEPVRVGWEGVGEGDVIFGGNLSIRRLNSNRKLIDLLQMCFTSELESL